MQAFQGGADGVDLVEGERLGCAADHEEFHCFAGVIEDSAREGFVVGGFQEVGLVGGFDERVGGEDSEVEFLGGALSDGGEVGANGEEGWVGGVADFAERVEGGLAGVWFAWERKSWLEGVQRRGCC
ncbi:MAG: hypothetical protein RI897_2184 [Verrucomicrobiota bacterium]